MVASHAVAATGTRIVTVIGTVTMVVIGGATETAVDTETVISAAIVTVTIPPTRVGSARLPPDSRRV